jgi:hypothetical protein
MDEFNMNIRLLKFVLFPELPRPLKILSPLSTSPGGNNARNVFYQTIMTPLIFVGLH